MALFNKGEKETKEERQERKARELLEKYGLDQIHNEADITTIRKIAAEMAGNGLIEFGTILNGKAEDVAKISYLRALLEQNWIIIRQLDRLTRLMEK